jgi:hypothetical protein
MVAQVFLISDSPATKVESPQFSKYSCRSI